MNFDALHTVRNRISNVSNGAGAYYNETFKSGIHDGFGLRCFLRRTYGRRLLEAYTSSHRILVNKHEKTPAVQLSGVHDVVYAASAPVASTTTAGNGSFRRNLVNKSETIMPPAVNRVVQA